MLVENCILAIRLKADQFFFPLHRQTQSWAFDLFEDVTLACKFKWNQAVYILSVICFYFILVFLSNWETNIFNLDFGQEALYRISCFLMCFCDIGLSSTSWPNFGIPPWKYFNNTTEPCNYEGFLFSLVSPRPNWQLQFCFFPVTRQ